MFPPRLRNIYVPKRPVQVEFCADRDRAYMWSSLHTRACPRTYVRTHARTHNAVQNSVEIRTPKHWNDRSQYNRPIVCVIAHQYSSATLILCFRSPKEIQGTSHRGGPGSILDQSMWDLWWTKWHWDRFFPELFGFPLSISFHRCSVTRKRTKDNNHHHHHHRVTQ
jgi:hypothetical protein